MSIIRRQMTAAIKAFSSDANVDALFCIEEDVTHFTMVSIVHLPMQQAWDYVRGELPVSMQVKKVTFEPVFGDKGLHASFLVEFDPEVR